MKKGAVIIARKPKNAGTDYPDYSSTTRTVKVLRKDGNYLLVKSLYYGKIMRIPLKEINEQEYVDIRNIPATCKKVWKPFMQVKASETGDKTYMAKNSGPLYVLYVTNTHIFGVVPDKKKGGHFRILDSRWSMDMFEECKAPKIDYAKWAHMMREGKIATSC